MSRDSSEAIETFLDARFPRSLLALADRTPILIHHIDDCWRSTAYGLVFLGFHTPIYLLVADDVDAGWVVLKDLHDRHGEGILVFSEADPVAGRVPPATVEWDPWMLVDVQQVGVGADQTCGSARPIADADELAAFLHRQGMSFWHRDMFEFGCAYGVRDAGELVATCALNFALERIRYAQIGGVYTLESHRGQGLASACVRATLSALGERGMSQAGLFADKGQPELVRLYQRLGFREQGRFGFVAVENLLTSWTHA